MEAIIKVQVYDPPMCCASGVCGTEIDQALVAFAGFLDQMKSKGAVVERFNLAQQPLAFIQNPKVKAFLDSDGADALPLIFVNGQQVMSGGYPDQEGRLKLARLIFGQSLEDE
jgi:hypothetical protein